MQNSRTLLIAIGALIAVIGAYFVGRADVGPERITVQTANGIVEPAPDAAPASGAAKSPSPLSRSGVMPPPDLPLRDSFAELQARAHAGDAAAASRLVRDLDRCSRLRGSQWRNASTGSDLTRHSTEGMSAAQLRTYQLQLDAMELRAQNQRKQQALCDGVGEDILDATVASIEQAARLGDEQARACYLERGPIHDARSLLKHPESLRAYRSAATDMIGRGLAAGDWRVVDLLQRAYEPGAQSLLAGLVGTDPVQHYRYLKLYRLGAEGHRVAELDRQLAAVAANLSAEQVAGSDQWAQTTLDDNFKGRSTNNTPLGWDACDF